MSNISEGAVLHFKIGRANNHFHIIANNAEDKDSVLLLGVITSHVQLRKDDAAERDEDPRTIVDISKIQCSCLKHDSVVDCNQPLSIKKDKLKELIEANKVNYKCSVSTLITESIRNGVLLSKQADNDKKGLLF